MTKSERCDLVDRVCLAVYEATESFEEHLIGEHLAYLLWEITKPSGGGVDWTAPRSRYALDLFVVLFPPSDPVWDYITAPVKRHFIVTGRVPFQDQMMADVLASSPKHAVRTFTEGWLYDGECMPIQWWDMELNPKTGDPWYIIDGVIEINGPPIAIHADHEINDI